MYYKYHNSYEFFIESIGRTSVNLVCEGKSLKIPEKTNKGLNIM